MAVRSRIKSRIINPPNSSAIEQIWVAISTVDATLYVCVIYIPPDRVNDAVLVERHIESVNWIVSQMGPRDNVVILGDFNLSTITWHRNPSGVLFPNISRSSIGQTSRELLDGYSTARLNQMNGVENEYNRTLDLCYVSEELCANCTTLQAPAPLVKIARHHPPLLIKLEIDPFRCCHDSSESVSYDFSRANFDGMNDFFSRMNWDEILCDSDANLAASTLSGVLLYAIDQFVPVKSKCQPTKPVWSNSVLKNLKRVKQAALRRHSKNRTDSTRVEYLEANTAYKQLNDRLYNAYMDRLQSRLKTNPKSFWHYVNDQRKESGLPSTMSNGLIDADSTTSIADMFRSQFSNVFTNEQLGPDDVVTATQNVPHFPAVGLQFAITNDAVVSAGKEMKSSTGCGPDGIPSLVIKRCINSLAAPLTTVFNLSLESGVFPYCWKQSYVIPVFKKGCKRTVSNYRGIASLSATSKLLELIVLKNLVQCYSHYISQDQHGFIPKRSTTSNLTCFTSYLIRQIECGHQVDAIYTDLSAAFDKMNHQIALAKFDKLGMNDRVLCWLRSYLTGRSMSVKIGDYVSPAFQVWSGVPQGSHLGPFLFLLYMNDVNFILKCMKLSYADDLKLYFTIKQPRDAIFLQHQLESFAEWCRVNRMSLNVSKCSVISFGRKHSLVHFDYALGDEQLKRESTVKDLGVLIDSKLSFKDHIAYIIAKASSQLGFLFRFAKKFKDAYCLKSLYCSIVRPILEYSSVVWAPFYQNEVHRIERIQRKFIRFALRHLNWRNPLNLPSYESRCQLIDLEPLVARRNVAKACFIGDLLQGNIDCSTLLGMLDINIRSRNLRSHSFFSIPSARTNYGQHEPIRSMSRLFNKCYFVFDFNVSREANKRSFKRVFCY